MTNKYKKYTGTKSYVNDKNYQYCHIALDGLEEPSIFTNKYKKYTGTKSYVNDENYQYWVIALDGFEDISIKPSESKYFSNVRVNARHGVF